MTGSPVVPPGTMRLSPRLRDRVGELAWGRGWRRIVHLRRAAAGALTVLALVLVVAPRAGPSGVPVLVAAVELPPGSTVRAGDVAVRVWPAELVPGGVLHDPAAVDGHVLVGAAHAGEALTDVRVVGAGPVPADEAAVSIRLADAGVAALIVPGSRVDVVTVGERTDAPSVLATDAQVLAVLAEEKGTRGRLVMIGLGRDTARRVASASLTDQITLTLR